MTGKYKKRNRVSYLAYGVGVVDKCMTEGQGRIKKSYMVWRSMLCRCYTDKYPTYAGCYVEHAWLSYSNFERWFDRNYVHNYDLDKDILVAGNKVYSASTCCFVPRHLNRILLSCRRARGSLPQGVGYHAKLRKFAAKLHMRTRQVYIGLYPTAELAHEAYVKAKQAYIISVACEEFEHGTITLRVKRALIRAAKEHRFL